MIFKHAKNFVGDKSGKPIFQGIHFNDNTACVTNGYALIGLKNWPISEKMIIHYKTRKPIAGEPLNFNSCLPKSFVATCSLTAPAKNSVLSKLIDVLKIAKLLKADNAAFFLSYKDNKNYFETKSKLGLFTGELDFKWELTGVKEFRLCINARALLNVLAFLKDCEANRIEFKFSGSLTPLVIDSDVEAFGLVSQIHINS